ncbi:MAG: leucine-rich repeat domain-containing protein [Muribaculum sp.]|nr:leucine-rich repeat domain-containing protein [Muribaculum sp.]
MMVYKYLKYILSVLVFAIFSSCGEEEHDDGLILGDTFVSGGVVYMKLSEREVGVERVEEQPERLSIPRNVKNNKVKYSVTCINNYALRGDTAIVAVDLPPTINRIGSGAFSHCQKLKHVNFYGADVEICNGAFQFSAIETITIPRGSWLGLAVFAKCEELSECILPSDLKIIPESCFYQCHSLKTLDIPESVEYIGGEAFFQTGVKPPFTGWR